MRRTDREVKELDAVFAIVGSCSTVHLAMVDDGKPYVVALNFGWERDGGDLILYFHSAQEGRKISVLKKNPSVYFQMDCVNEFIEGTQENPCAYCWRYDSVMGSGQAEFLEEAAEKRHALNCLIQRVGKTEAEFQFPPAMLAKTCVFRVRSSDFTGKHHE